MMRLKKILLAIKSNILVISLVVLVAVIATAGGTIAYFSDNREMSNVFTAGNVYISLTEAAVKSDGRGNLVEDTEAPRVQGVAIDSDTDVKHNFGVLFPGKVMHKDPTIQNTGDDPAWIAAKIIITDGDGDINKLFGYQNSEEIDIRALLSGGVLDGTGTLHVGTWNGMENVCYDDAHAMVQVADAANGVYEFYFFFNKALVKDEKILLFDTMTVNHEFTNSDMQEFANLEITVQAFAVQTFGFDSCYTAMRTAFADHFELVSQAQE